MTVELLLIGFKKACQLILTCYYHMVDGDKYPFSANGLNSYNQRKKHQIPSDMPKMTGDARPKPST